jgi:hypothetical protein
VNLEPDCSIDTLIAFAEDLLIDLSVQRLWAIVALVVVENHPGVRARVIVKVTVPTERSVSDVIDDIRNRLKSSVVLWILVGIPVTFNHDFSSFFRRFSCLGRPFVKPLTLFQSFVDRAAEQSK